MELSNCLEWLDINYAYLLVGLVLAVGVADLRGDVVLLRRHVVADTSEVGPLQVGIKLLGLAKLAI